MPISFTRQSVLETGDPGLQLQPMPRLSDSVAALGFNPRAVEAYDAQMEQWRQGLQQQLIKKFAVVNETTVQGGGAGIPAAA